MALTVNGKNDLLTTFSDRTTLFIRIMDNAGTPVVVDTQALDFGAASAGKVDITGNIVFNVGAGVTVASLRFGLISGEIMNEFGIVAITPETFATAGTYTLTKFEITLT